MFTDEQKVFAETAILQVREDVEKSGDPAGCFLSSLLKRLFDDFRADKVTDFHDISLLTAVVRHYCAKHDIDPADKRIVSTALPDLVMSVAETYGLPYGPDVDYITSARYNGDVMGEALDRYTELSSCFADYLNRVLGTPTVRQNVRTVILEKPDAVKKKCVKDIEHEMGYDDTDDNKPDGGKSLADIEKIVRGYCRK